MTQADGNVPPQFPEGMQENGMGRPPEDNDGPPRQMQGEKWTAPPQGGAGGGMMSGNGVSIVTFMTNRLENLKQQLAGEIPTTGNTTMNRNNGQGSGRPGQQPQKQEIKVKLDGTQIQFDQQPVLENDRTLVPLRAVFEALGMTVEWEQESQTVTAVNSDTVIRLTVGDTTAYVNGAPVQLETAAKIVADRTLVPVRFIAESAGLQVEWEQASQTVVITSAN